MVTVEMAQALLTEFGDAREKAEPVKSVGFSADEISNVMSVIGINGSYLGQLAYRPHDIGKPGYDEHGLLIV
jgi:hypothetical protein